jgi:hypothetical protein
VGLRVGSPRSYSTRHCGAARKTARLPIPIHSTLLLRHAAPQAVGWSRWPPILSLYHFTLWRFKGSYQIGNAGCFCAFAGCLPPFSGCLHMFADPSPSRSYIINREDFFPLSRKLDLDRPESLDRLRKRLHNQLSWIWTDPSPSRTQSTHHT